MDMFQAKLSQEIQQAYNNLIALLDLLPASARITKEIEGTGGKVSPADLIAYQIGWGLRVIDWYETGVKGKLPVMPGDGFHKWEYNAIARLFYEKYAYDQFEEQAKIFHQVVLRILAIVEKEEQTGNLHRLGIWPWCTLASKKQWPLSKWIQINTVSPYKKASRLLKRAIGSFTSQ